MSNYIVAIDPSINSTGLSVFLDKKLMIFELISPSKSNKGSYIEKSCSIVDKIRSILNGVVDRENVNCVLEIPDYWNVAGQVARESGGIQKLSFVCGMIYSCLRVYSSNIKTPVPKEWKGQLSKDVMCNRLRDHYLKQNIDLIEINHNVVDAIGLGHWYIYGRV